MFTAQTTGSAAGLDPARAWEPYVPDGERPWNLRLAGHLLRRAGLGGDWSQLQQALAEGPQKTVDRLTHPDAEAFNRQQDQQEAAALDSDAAGLNEVGQWWLRRMILTPDPLREKITLFLHGYLALDGSQVGSQRLIRQHVQLLRTEGKHFDRLLRALCRDPATLLATRCAQNTAKRVNENFARALVERFTVGPGRMSGEEIHEAARALTGAIVLRKRYLFDDRDRDRGTKRILGRSGDFQADEVVQMLLARPETSQRLARGLYRWFVSEAGDPAAELLEPLSQDLERDWNLDRVVARMLRSNWFFSAQAYRQRIKSPVELGVGTVRAMQGLVPTAPLADDLAGLGQRLGQTPTSAGWEGGSAWLNPWTLVARQNLAVALVAGSGRYGDGIDPGRLAERHGFGKPGAAAGFFSELLLQGDLPAAACDAMRQVGTTRGDLRRVVQLAIVLPEYQLD